MTQLKDYALADEQVDDQTHIFTLRGEIDIVTAPKLGRRLLRAAEEGKTGLVVDLTWVTFIDSTGLSVLLNSVRRLGGGSGRMALVCPTKALLRPFETAGLTGRLSIFRTREEALGCVMA